MKRIIACGAVLIATLGVSHISLADTISMNPASVFQELQGVENMVRIKSATISTEIPYGAIFTALEANCDMNQLGEIDGRVDAFVTNPANIGYFSLDDLASRTKNFNTIKSMIGRVDQKDIGVYCGQKYFLYHILQRIQSPEGATEAGNSEITIIHDDALASENMPFLYLTDYYTQKYLTQMLAERVLLPSDVAMLDNKIHIHYVEQCGMMHGLYQMTQSPGGANKNLTKIQVNINLCKEEYYLNNFEQYVAQLLTHELGHYLYYFRDNTKTTFDLICRKEGKNICGNQDFVSGYSQTSKEEDYAESFAYRYLVVHGQKYDPHSSGKKNDAYLFPVRITRKLEYFEKIFEPIE